MSFNIKSYLNLLFNKKITDANKYRKENMPKILFKYVSLHSNYCSRDSQKCSNEIELNESKFSVLKNNQLWMSRFDKLNDPFEYKAMIFDKDKLSTGGHNINVLNRYIDDIRNSLVVASFTTNLVNNMPMWAHYANNHQGFCIEYEVINPGAVYPVFYEENRFPANVIFTNFMNSISQLHSGKIGEVYENLKYYTALVHHFGVCKHISWEYENEYRIQFVHKSDNKIGTAIPLENLGLQINSIYIGFSCSVENRKRIIDVANHLNINVYEIKLNDSQYILDFIPAH